MAFKLIPSQLFGRRDECEFRAALANHDASFACHTTLSHRSRGRPNKLPRFRLTAAPESIAARSSRKFLAAAETRA